MGMFARMFGLEPSPLLDVLAAGTTQPLSPWTDSSQLEAVTHAALFGSDMHAVHMNRDRAMKLSVVSAARRKIAGTIGRLPFTLTRGGIELPLSPLLTQPEYGRTRSHTLTWTADALIFYPWVHWLVTERDTTTGYPTRVQLVPKHLERMNDAGELIGVGNHDVSPINAIRIDSPSAGLLIDGSDTLRRAWIIAQAASKAEANPVPALDLHNTGEDLTQDEIEQLLDSWENARRRRGVGYSSRGLEVKALGVSTEQLLIAGRRHLDLELVRHLGIPAWAADVPIEGSSLNYTNRASRNSDLIDGALAPYLTAIADRLSMNDVTPNGQTVAFNTDDLVKPLRAERLKTLADAVNAGILTVDEARAEESLPPLKEPQQE